MRKKLLLLLFAAVAMVASAALPRIGASQAAELVKEGKAIKVSSKVCSRMAADASDARFHKATPSKLKTKVASHVSALRPVLPRAVPISMAMSISIKN